MSSNLRHFGCLVFVCACACTFGGDGGGAGGSLGLGEGGQGSSDDALPGDDGMTSADGNADGSGATDGGTGMDTSAGSTADDATDASETSGAGSSKALLVFPDGPVAVVQATVPEGDVFVFELQNDGMAPATNIMPADTGDPAFVFDGGFPGAGGTCGAILQPGADCLIGLRYQPFMWGHDSGTLGVSYAGGDAGSASMAVEGVGGGITDNQLANGDFEAGLASWTPSPSSWMTTADDVGAGSVAFAGTDAGAVLLRLRQDVALDPWAALVDQGQVAIVLGVDHRAGAVLNNAHSLTVEYRDGNGILIATFDSGSWTGANWDAYATSDAVPADARSARLTLNCLKPAPLGDSTCDAYFDDVTLRIQFPLPD